MNMHTLCSLVNFNAESAWKNLYKISDVLNKLEIKVLQRGLHWLYICDVIANNKYNIYLFYESLIMANMEKYRYNLLH